MNEFREQINRLRADLRGTVHITVSRDSVVADLVNAYTENEHMENSSLAVDFKDEDGVDEGGLTKECLRLFWDQFLQKHCTGRLQKAPKVDYRYVKKTLFQNTFLNLLCTVYRKKA